jgi:glycosyltransferase involved in cell wall biosynthesis
MSTNLVSVIIPVFNRSNCLRDAVMSTLLQTYTHIEIIIVNDGSTDDTLITANELAKKWPRSIHVLNQTNAGPGPARQLGTIHSCGEFIQYLDSDDILLPTKLEKQVISLTHSPKSGICYGLSYQEDYAFDPPLLTGPMRLTGEEVNHLFPKLLNDRWWTTTSPLYRRSLIKSIGSWKDLINEEDWEFDARAARLCTHLCWISIGVSVRRINLSHDHLSAGGCVIPRKLADRVIAKQLIYKYATTPGIDISRAEMQIFAKGCFLLSAQCALVGLNTEASLMLRLSRQAASGLLRESFIYFLYYVLVCFFGSARTASFVSRLRAML